MYSPLAVDYTGAWSKIAAAAATFSRSPTFAASARTVGQPAKGPSSPHESRKAVKPLHLSTCAQINQ